MSMVSRRRALAALTPLVCLSCVGHRLVAPEPQPTREQRGQWVQQPKLKLDILFMVDDSLSMKDKQDNLVRNFPRFMRVLEGAVPAGGTLDAHIAVVSSDLGVATPSGALDPCRADGGDRGVFRSAPQGSCAGPRGSYIITNDVGKNFDGDVADVFACIARLGIGGCGFEHQLASVRRALGGDPAAPMPPENAGFLRPDARLGVVLITDEDDCSAPTGSDLFTDDPAALATLGPRESYRCNEAGHLCGGAPPPRATVNGLTCQPNETPSSGLIHVSELVDFFRGLKRDPDLLRVAAIAGPATPYATVRNGEVTSVSPSCKGATDADTGFGWPGVRLASFVAAFGDRGVYESICEPDFGPAMEHIARALIPVGVPCLPGRPVDVDPARPGVQADCNVLEEQPRELQAPAATVVPSCDRTGGAAPCWRLGPDARCAAAPDGLAIVVDHGATTPADDTRSTWSCLVCTAGDDGPGCAR